MLGYWSRCDYKMPIPLNLLDDIEQELEAEINLKKSKIRLRVASILGIVQIVWIFVSVKYWHPSGLYMNILKTFTMVLLPIISFVVQYQYRSRTAI